MTRLRFVGLLALLADCSAATAEPPPTTVALREQVLNAHDSRSKAKAYKALFLHVGRAGLQELTKDTDTGITLQAAWELNKKAVKRAKPIRGISDDTYDPDELAKFLAFLRERTNAPVPEWWSESIGNTQLFPGESHSFECWGKHRGDSVTSLETGKRFVLANCPLAGFAYKFVGYESKGGKQVWVADVWSAGRWILAGVGYHHVELKERDGCVFVFGMESHGMYLEAFEMATGKCLYRFCSCYWFDFPEKWGLK